MITIDDWTIYNSRCIFSKYKNTLIYYTTMWPTLHNRRNLAWKIMWLCVGKIWKKWRKWLPWLYDARFYKYRCTETAIVTWCNYCIIRGCDNSKTAISLSDAFWTNRNICSAMTNPKSRTKDWCIFVWQSCRKILLTIKPSLMRNSQFPWKSD